MAQAAWAQPGALAPGNRFELSDSVELDRADSSVEKQLERVRAHLAEKHWDEAVETLLQVMEHSGQRLLEITDPRLLLGGDRPKGAAAAARRYVSVRDACNVLLSLLPPEALALYRSRVDAQARLWYETGVAERNPRLLLNVVDQAFASSWGAKALLALGEMALESGQCAAARAYWEMIVPVDAPPDVPPTWLRTPAPELDLAGVRARLVLASILEGSAARAGEELKRLAQLHPESRGWLGGREAKYAEALASLLADSADWPAVPSHPDWTTFAGSPARNKAVSDVTDVGPPAWRVALRPTIPANRSIWGTQRAAQRVAEDPAAPLSYHPLLLGDLVLINNQVEILALDVRTGKPAWGHGRAAIYEDQLDDAARLAFNPPDNLGVPRFTMTAHAGRLYARMGSAVTSQPQQRPGGEVASCLVCLDLESEGRLMWRTVPEERGWAFEGSPLVDGSGVYVAMRRSDIQPQVHVACLDAETGRLRWRRFICAAETPARGMLHETTHLLLALDGPTLYVNTNLGAVAALAARDGRIQWVSLYPRVRQGDLIQPEPHTCRDLTPCLYDRGRLLVAPADSRRIFALDAATGLILWQTGSEVEDVVHLLGVVGDKLIASGHRLYWIGMKDDEEGKVVHRWPDGPDRLGYGRGILAGGRVWWPTRDRIYLFDQLTGQQKKVVLLAPHGLSGGNLLVGRGHVLIATAKDLIALGPAPTQAEDATRQARSTPEL